MATWGGSKYPYNPYYGGFGPRIALAWSPTFSGGLKEKMFGHNSTVIRGGYSRIFTRENGVDLVLVPLLGVGLFQGNSCTDPTTVGSRARAPMERRQERISAWNRRTCCTASGSGSHAPQPVYPGVNGAAKATNTLMLDSALRPGSTDQYNLSMQRSFAKGFILEAGYIGINAKHLYMGVDLDQVPFMSTLGGQSFAQAYATIAQATLAGNVVQPQPFIEAAMAGNTVRWIHQLHGCGACSGCIVGLGSKTSSCKTSTTSGKPFRLHFNTTIFPPFNPATGFGGTETSLNGQASSEYMASSLGISNYNAGYVSLKKQTSFGLTFNANLTYSHELGSVNGGQAFNGESPTNSWDPAHSDYTLVDSIIGSSSTCSVRTRFHSERVNTDS